MLRARGLSGPSPVILLMHGYTGTAAGIEKYAELTASANRAGVAVAYPEGTPTRDGGFGWSTGAGIFATSGVDDVAALADMTGLIIATGCIDPQRMILTGESNGGGMALLAICSSQLSGMFSEIVLVNAAIDDGVLAQCVEPIIPVPLTVVAGLLDRTVPFYGGKEPLLSQQALFDRVAAVVNRCDATEQERAVSAHVARTAGIGCSACTELLAIDDGTHTWPGTSKGVAGLIPGSFDLNSRLITRATGESPGCIAGT